MLQQRSRMCQGNRGKDGQCSNVKLATEKLPECYQQGTIQQTMDIHIVERYLTVKKDECKIYMH